MATKKELTVKEEANTDLAMLGDSFMDNMDEFANNATAEDMAIPRLAIAQALSKICERGHADYNAEVNIGDFYDKSQDLHWDGEEGVLILPISYRRTYIEWNKRDFVADHGLDLALVNSCTKDEKGKMITPDGGTLVQTAEYAVFVLDGEGGYFPAMISMSGAQFKKSKNWQSKINNLLIDTPQGKRNPPCFYKSYLLKTQPEKNDQGSWFGYNIAGDKTVTELEKGGEIWKAAVEFRKQMDAGEVKVASYESEGETIDEDDDSAM